MIINKKTRTDETKTMLPCYCSKRILYYLSKVTRNNPNLVKALKFGRRCDEKYLANEFLKKKNQPRKCFVKVEEEGRLKLLK